MNEFILLALFSGILSSFSQVLLKKSSEKHITGYISQYINPYVITGYGIMAICMFLTVIAYKGIPYKMGPVLESLGYLYIMVLSRVFFDEKITKNKVIGNLLIVAGVIVFNIVI